MPLDTIARRAGVGPGTVHRHFPTKNALVAAVASARVARLAARARERATSEDPGVALRDQLSEMLAEGDHSTPLKTALAGSEFDRRVTAPDSAAELRAAVGALLERAQHAGSVRGDIDIDDLMATLAGTFHAIQHAGVTTRSKRAQRLTRLLFDSLAVTPTR